MNRKERRSESVRLRKLRAKNPNVAVAEELIRELQVGNEQLQRVMNRLEYANRAAQVASTIPVLAKSEDWTESDGEPNWERDKLLTEAKAAIEDLTPALAGAYLDMVELIGKLDEPISDLTVVGAGAVRSIRGL